MERSIGMPKGDFLTPSDIAASNIQSLTCKFNSFAV